jgi:hypothetical protein
MLGLPGSLGQDVAIATRNLLAAEGETVSPLWNAAVIRTAKGQRLAGHYYDVGDESTNRYRTVISKRILVGSGENDDVQGSVQLPRALFSDDGVANTPDPPNREYFSRAGHSMVIYDGDQLFDPTNDPTAGTAQGTVIWVEGNATLLNVELEEWSRADVVLVASETITAENLHCGWTGRIVLVARDVSIHGRRERWIQGIVVASGDVQFQSLEPPADQWVIVPDDPSQGIGPAAFFFGSIVAGGDVRFEQGGWAVVFDRHVINGLMGLSPQTHILDRFETESGLDACWSRTGQVLEMPKQGSYHPDEIDNQAADSGDGGIDANPQVLRITITPGIDDAGVGDTLQLHLDGSPADCDARLYDWATFRSLRFFMVLDNYRKATGIAGGRRLITEREVEFSLRLRDQQDHWIEYDLSNLYEMNRWGDRPYKLDPVSGDVIDADPSIDDVLEGHLPGWLSIDVPFNEMQGHEDFDLENVAEVHFRVNAVDLDWRIEDEETGTIGRWVLEDLDGELKYRPMGAGPRSVREAPGDGRLQFWDPTLDTWVDILWDGDAVDQGGDGDFADDFLHAADLKSTLRVDRLILPGVSRQEYGISPFSLEIFHWRELGERDIRE